jgi:hypothetical protein
MAIGSAGLSLVLAGTGLARTERQPASEATAPASPVASAFVPLAPQRLFDTRDEGASLSAGQTTTRRVLGSAGVPASGVAAVVLTVTLVDATEAGFVTVWPADSPMPGVSNVNADRRGDTMANLVSVIVPADGRISLFTSSGGHLLADVAGYYRTTTGPQRSGRFHTLTPARLADTRATGTPTTGSVDVTVTGLAAMPATGVAAVAVNVTVTNARRAGFVTVYPKGSVRPNVSSLNVNDSVATAAGSAIVAPGTGGQLTVFTDTGGDVIVDVSGWYGDITDSLTTAGLFVPIAPVRIKDTRTSSPPARIGPGVPAWLATGFPMPSA